jgi:hypothetical protein
VCRFFTLAGGEEVRSNNDGENMSAKKTTTHTQTRISLHSVAYVHNQSVEPSVGQGATYIVYLH